MDAVNEIEWRFLYQVTYRIGLPMRDWWTKGRRDAVGLRLIKNAHPAVFFFICILAFLALIVAFPFGLAHAIYTKPGAYAVWTFRMLVILSILLFLIVTATELLGTSDGSASCIRAAGELFGDGC